MPEWKSKGLGEMARLKAALVVVLALVCVRSGHSQTLRPWAKILTDSEFKQVSIEIEQQLPNWEHELIKIDPEKLPQISYAQGKELVADRDLAFAEVSYIRKSIDRMREKRSVSEELKLVGFIDGLLSVGQQIVLDESASGLTLTRLEILSPELGSSQLTLDQDVRARVELLEKNACE